MAELKVCSSCGIEKPTSDFHSTTRRKDGVVGTCKSCVRSRLRERTAQWREGADPYADQSPKRCGRCEQVKTRSEFNRSTDRADGLYYLCAECHRQQQRDKWVDDPEHMARMDRGRRLKRVGITHEQYDALYAEQGGRCAICNGLPGGKGDLHIDHDHETGRFRGLLCHSCNVSLGHFKDDVVLLLKAADYLMGTRDVLGAPHDFALSERQEHG